MGWGSQDAAHVFQLRLAIISRCVYSSRLRSTLNLAPAFYLQPIMGQRLERGRDVEEEYCVEQGNLEEDKVERGKSWGVGRGDGWQTGNSK